jgi:hypothetical protein
MWKSSDAISYWVEQLCPKNANNTKKLILELTNSKKKPIFKSGKQKT